MAKQWVTRRRVNFSAESGIGEWEGVFRRGFRRKVDEREALLLVCLLVGMEVAGKSCRWVSEIDHEAKP